MAPLQFLLMHFRRKVRVLSDRLWDRYYGIDTISGAMTPAQEQSRFSDTGINGPVSYWLLRKYIDRSAIQPHDVFVDVGCGHGRVLCFVARQPVAKCIGIELSAEFGGRAEANARTLRRRIAPIEVRVGDAVDACYDEGTLFFFGAPFGYQTLACVLANIRQTLQMRPRKIVCILWMSDGATPLFDETLRSSGWLFRSGVRRKRYSPFRAEYWTNRPSGILLS